jgi:hypothetical protein
MDARARGLRLQSRCTIRAHAHPRTGWAYLAGKIHKSRVHRRPHRPRLPRRQSHSLFRPFIRDLLRSVGRSVRRGRWGFALNVDKRVERICRAISKQVQRSDAGIEVDVMHTGNELEYRALDKGLYDKRMYCRALDKGLQERRGEEYRD